MRAWSAFLIGAAALAVWAFLDPAQLPSWAPSALFAMSLVALANLSLRPVPVGGLFAYLVGFLALVLFADRFPHLSTLWVFASLLFTTATVSFVALFGVPRTGKRAELALHTILVVFIGLVVAYYSGTAGGAGSMVSFLVRVFGLDPEVAGQIVVVLRKSLHFCFYGLFALSAARLARLLGLGLAPSVLLGIGWAFSHAVFDELRQTGASGRTGSPTDVLLDLAGMVVFTAPIWIGRRCEPSA